jgi:anthranilate phosphoribosyltransferase
MREAVTRLLARQDLTRAQMTQAMEALLAGEASAAQVGAFAAALRMKRETDDELVAAAEVVRARAHRFSPEVQGLLDCSGTGGDGSHSLNVSTTSAFVLAAAGVPVAKSVHRAVTSRCGSAEVLAALGVPLERTPEALVQDLREHKLAFLHTPTLHPGLRNVVGRRNELGFSSFLNLLGPLVNAAGVRDQLVGCHDAALLERMARVLGRLGSARAWVVRGRDGLDEVSPSAPTDVAALQPEGTVHFFTLTPEDAGLTPVPPGALEGGEPAANARHIRAMLAGEESPLRTAVLLNCAAALVMSGRVAHLREGAAVAARAIDSGAAMAKLAALAHA